LLRFCIRLWLLAVLVVPVAALAEPDSALNSPLPVDASVEYRVLPNGMHYWIRPNTGPHGKVSMWLRINSGSLNEEDDQRGLAHLLEHLAFNGSTNFPTGTLIKRFEAAGLTFGAHQNATTGFLDTIYKLDLPNNAQTVDMGLLFFADVAHRLTLDAGEVARERHVVLAEGRARDNAAKRAFHRQLVALAPGSRFVERFPIGDEQVVRTATAEQLRAYYRKWYRPDNATLLIAGDFDAATLDAMVRKHFNSWPATAKTAPGHETGIRPYPRDRAEIISEYGLIAADVNVASVESARNLSNERGYREWLVGRIGTQLINRRLRDLVLEGRVPFTSASAVSDTSFGAMLVETRAKGAPLEWEKVVKGLVTEIKRVRDHGFTDDDFRYGIDVVRAEFEKDVLEERDWPASRWLTAMDAAIEERTRPIGARQEYQVARRLLGDISRAEVEASVRARYASGQRTFTLSLPRRDDLQAPTAAQVLQIVQALEAAEVAKLPERSRPQSLLAQDPQPGAVVEQQIERDVDVTSATLANGVRVHVRPLTNRKDHASVRIMLAGGRVNETPLNRGITEVAALPLKVPATAALSSSDIQRMMSTKQVTVTGRDTAGALELDIEGQRRDVEEGLRLAHLLLTRARIEPAVFQMWQRQALVREANREGSVDAQLNDRVDALLTSNDPRFRVLTPKEVQRLTLADGQAWLDGILAAAPIEVAIVGDYTHEQALALAAKYLGSLPKRPTVVGAHAGARALSVAPGPHQAQVKVDTATPRAMVYVGWRGPDWRDVHDWQVLDVAGRIITNRLFAEVRERRGLAYTIRARSSSNTLYKGNGRFRVSFAVDPLKADEAADLVQQVIDEFMRTGPTSEELRTALEQASASFRSGLGTAEFWLDILSDLDYMGGDLGWVKGYTEQVKRYTHEDVMEVLKKYLRPDRFVRVIGAPAELPATVPAVSKEPVATVN
jgi:zinc protease